MYNSNCGEEDRQFAEQKVHSINQYLEKKKSADKGSACNAGNLGSVLGLERSPGEGKGYSLQYSGLENPMDSQRVRHDRATFTFKALNNSKESLVSKCI